MAKLSKPPLNGSYQAIGTDPAFHWDIRIDMPEFSGATAGKPCISGDIFSQNNWNASWRCESPQAIYHAETNTWALSGEIGFTNGAEAWQQIRSFQMTVTPPRRQQKARLTLQIQMAETDAMVLSGEWTGPWYRTFKLEYDVCASVNNDPVLPLVADTKGKPEKDMNLSRAFALAGIHLQLIPSDILDDADLENIPWTQASLHHLMETKYQGFGPQPKWEAWALLAGSLFEDPNVAGYMFDHVEAPERQGFAIFKNNGWFAALLRNTSGAEALRTAHLRYLHTWAHEIGHLFNLVHPNGIRSQNLTWMNYFNNIGEARFWKKFKFQFDKSELLQLRHYPWPNVVMGGLGYSSSAFAKNSLAKTAGVELLVRSKGRFDCLEPVWVELRLRNTTGKNITINTQLRPEYNYVHFYVRRKGEADWHAVHAHGCFAASPAELALYPEGVGLPGSDRFSSYVPVFYNAENQNGFIFTEPGQYELQAVYQWKEVEAVSGIHELSIHNKWADEIPDARNFLSREVALNLHLGGSLLGERNNEVYQLLERTEKVLCPKNAGLALARAMAHAAGDDHVKIENRRFMVQQGDPEKALYLTQPYLQYFRGKSAEEKHYNLPYHLLVEQRSRYHRKMNNAAEILGEYRQLAQDLERRDVDQAVLLQLPQGPKDLNLE